MANRQALLSVIEQLPDEKIVQFLAFAQNLSSTTVENSSVELSSTQLADLRSRLSQFAGEWDSPEMEIYDDYDTYKSQYL